VRLLKRSHVKVQCGRYGSDAMAHCQRWHLVVVIARVFLRQRSGGCELYASWFDIQRASARETRRHAQNQQEAGGCRARDEQAIKELTRLFRTGKARKAGTLASK
jgi:hypothetical protein